MTIHAVSLTERPFTVLFRQSVPFLLTDGSTSSAVFGAAETLINTVLTRHGSHEVALCARTQPLRASGRMHALPCGHTLSRAEIFRYRPAGGSGGGEALQSRREAKSGPQLAICSGFFVSIGMPYVCNCIFMVRSRSHYAKINLIYI